MMRWKRVKRVLLGASIACVLAVATAASVAAQEVVIPNLDEYAKGAKSVTNVTLDKNALGLASGFMDGKDKDQGQAKNIASRMNGIYIHTFEYSTDWAYDRKSVADLRKHLTAPEWSNIVSTHDNDKDGDTDIWIHIVNGTAHGMMIIDAGPRDLNFVQIDGELRPEDLQDMQGNFGVPKIPKIPKQAVKPGKDGKSELDAAPDAGTSVAVVPAAPTR